MTRHPSCVVLLGLDGAAFPVLEPLLDEGTMPVLAEMLRSGVSAALQSTPHPLSPPAWASIMTGCSPGQHGVFDFVRIDHSAGAPAYTLVSSADLRVPTVFGMASHEGRRVTALNFSCMFPPPELNGVVVPGYVPWSYLGRACHPRTVFRRLKEHAGVETRKLAVDWELERTAIQGLPAEDLARWVALHVEREEQWARILLHLMRTEPSELTAIVIDGVDRIQHLCLHLMLSDPTQLTPAARQVRSACRDYFALVDRLLGQVVEAAGPEAAVLVVSDHGARLAGHRIFYANTWLERQGLLRWSDGVPVDTASRLASNGNAESTRLFDWSHTRAAALTSSSNAIVVRRSRVPGEPGVPADEYRAFCRRLADDLLAAVDPVTGERIVERVLLRDDAFAGAASVDAPDLTLELRSPGFLSVLRGADVTTERTSPYATHDPEGIFIAYGAGVGSPTRLGRLSVVDVAPTVLHLLGLAIPAHMTGRPVLDALDPSLRRPRRESGLQRDLVPASLSASGLDAEGEAEVVARLRSLGYLE